MAKTCKECGDWAIARGLCNKHYRQERMRDPAFVAAVKEHERKRLRDPVRTAKRNARRMERWHSGVLPKSGVPVLERLRRNNRKARSGFTEELVVACRELQRGVCAICPRELTKQRGLDLDAEHADHCHATKTPRGLLCKACNVSLGYYEKHQRPVGLHLQAYEDYLSATPVSRLTRC